jgi:hypothetical protein
MYIDTDIDIDVNLYIYVQIVTHLYTENGNAKQPFVFCKQKTEDGSFFLGRQTINGNRRLLCQQTCPSMGKNKKEY